MTKLSNLLLVWVALCTMEYSFCQSTFRKTSLPDSYWMPTTVAEYVDDGYIIGVSLSSTTGSKPIVSRMSSNGDVVWSRKLPTYSVIDIETAADGGIYILSRLNDAHPGFGGRLAIIKMDASGALLWSRTLGFVSLLPIVQSLHVTNDGDVLVTSKSDGDGNYRFWFSKISREGVFLWTQSIAVPNTDLHAYTAESLDDGTALFGGVMKEGTITTGIVAKVGQDGGIIWVNTYADIAITGISAAADGKLILTGKSGGEAQRTIVMKTTENGLPIWGRSLSESSSSLDRAVETQDGGITLVMCLYKKVASVVKLNSEGNLAWAQGVCSAREVVATPIETADLGLVFVVNVTNSYLPFSKGEIVKTDAEGRLADCSPIPVCIDMAAIEIEVSPLTTYSYEAVSLDQADTLQLSPFFTRMVTNCTNPPASSPYFVVPDTICVGSSVSPTELNHVGAETYYWSFQGGNPVESAAATPDSITFSDSGTYQLTQWTTYNGCVDSFSRILAVRPPPDSPLRPDILVCTAPPYLIDARIPGGINYRWSDGLTEPVREVNLPTALSVIARDRYCEIEMETQVDFLSDLYPITELDVGLDTLICEGKSYVINATIPNAYNYAWDNGDNSPQREVTSSGWYTVSAMLLGCPLSDTINVQFEDCSGKIYVPNIFSPNNDGVNDNFMPVGIDIEVERLEIYDRWGSLVFQSEASSNGWDGTFEGENANVGAYLYLISYINTRNNVREILTGEFMLIR